RDRGERLVMPRSCRPHRQPKISHWVVEERPSSWPGIRPRVPRNDGQIGTSLRRTGALRDIERRDRAAKTLQLQVSEILQPRYRFDGASDAAADQDQPVLCVST